MSILELANITKSFGGVRAVDNASLGFEEGKITCLIGPNGAGKTTLFNIITGALRADSGSIFYRGKDITNLPSWRTARVGIGRLFQDVRVFGRMTVLDNVLTAFRGQSGESALMSLLTPGKVSREEKALNVRGRRLLEFVGLADRINDLGEDLSYGQQKLLAIARLLAADADVFLLDEPTAGVNPQRVKALLDLIRRLAGEGKTVVIIEHNMTVVIEIANWVYFLDEGQVAAFGMPEEVLADPEVRTAYVGL